MVPLLIALLCGIAGAVDALAYLCLGHLFVANLTGNTVLFAYQAAVRHWLLAAERLGLILGFFSGVVTNRLLARWIHSQEPTLQPSTVSLAIECVVLCVFAFLGVHGSLRAVLLIALAWTMGLQNDAFQKIGPVALNTTFMTGDIEKLGSVITSNHETWRRQKIIGFATAWTAYACGAVIGAVGSHFFGVRALLLPAAMVLMMLMIELRR